MSRQLSKLKSWQRIFVNRSLNMGSIKAIGFDMDHTLALYDRNNFEALAFRETLKKFIAAGYPEELADLKFAPNYAIRGLLVDRERGNFLKVDGHKYVKIAYHGKTKLEKEQRHQLYNHESFRADAFLSLDSFFALSEVQLFCDLVDFKDRYPSKIQKSYREIYADLRLFIDLSHADGSIKKAVLANLDQFILRDKYLPETLARQIEAGKQLFLLTNSHWEYTQAVMSYVLDGQHSDFPSWRDYFEYVIVGANKPGFFMGSQQFYEVVGSSDLLRVHSGPLESRHAYHGGHARLFQHLTGLKGDEILYVGDHLYSDIIRSKGLFNWRTMLVVSELEAELPKNEDLKEEFESILNLTAEREWKDEEVQILRSKMSANAKQIAKAKSKGDNKRCQYLEKEQEKLLEEFKFEEQKLAEQDLNIRKLMDMRQNRFHQHWGELMKAGFEKSRFAAQLEDYACVYASRVSHLRFYSPFKRFTSTHDFLPHEF